MKNKQEISFSNNEETVNLKYIIVEPPYWQYDSQNMTVY